VNVGGAVRKYEADIVRGVRELIGIRSVREEPLPGKPYGEGINLALQYVLTLGESLSFTARNVDGFAGHLEAGSGPELAALLVHVDTVSEGDGWSVDPFAAVLQGRRLYGRGASDNKGPAIVALYALKAALELVAEPKRTFRIIVGTDEESGMTDIDHYLAKERLPDYAFVPDASYPIIHAEKAYYVLKLTLGTDAVGHRTKGEKAAFPRLRIVEAEGGSAPNVVPDRCRVVLEFVYGTARDRGGLYENLLQMEKAYPHITVRQLEDGKIELTAKGKSGHGSYPPSGVNAIARMAEFMSEAGLTGNGQAEGTKAGAEAPAEAMLAFLNRRIGSEAFGESLGIACEHPVHGRTTVNLAQLRCDECTAEAVLNVRIPPVVDDRAVIDALQQQLAEYGIELETVDYMPPLFVPDDHPLIRKLRHAYETVTGEPAKLLSIGGGTYARKLRGRGVAFGAGFPGTNTNAHQPDEFIDLEELMKHAEICTQAIYEWIRTTEA
jgi:succinyl-diaminopimelate desuccinylase